MSDGQKQKISKSRINGGVAKKEKNPNWQGGLTKKQVAVRNLGKYKEWRRKVYERDNYTCVMCGVKGDGKNLQADHIIPLSVLIREKKDIFDIKNGRTLCRSCHKKTDTYGWRVWNYYLKPNYKGGGLGCEYTT